MPTIIWSGACAPHCKSADRSQLASGDCKVAVAVRVIRIDGHRVAVDAIDHTGRVVKALALRKPQRLALDNVKFEQLPKHILGLLKLQPV